MSLKVAVSLNLSKGKPQNHRWLVLYNDGENISITASGEGVRFLFISGNPLKEPIAWQGPIVTNTNEELRTAFDEYRSGTLLKAMDD